MSDTNTAMLSELLDCIPFENRGVCDTPVSALAYASNKVGPGTVFFCIPGVKADGHDFAADAVSRGACALVVERFLDLDVPQYKVGDARRTLALASSAFFGHPTRDMKVVGITGTNGKTTTAFLTEHIAAVAGYTTGLVGTVETRIAGVAQHAERTTPESFDLQKLFADMRAAGVDVTPIEVSSHAIDLDRIAGTHFAVVAFSNLTQDHLDYHGTMENYYLAKERLFTSYKAPVAAVTVDDEYGVRIASAAENAGSKLITCGFSPDAHVRPDDPDSVVYTAAGTDLELVTPEGPCSFHLPLVGRFNVNNALLALSIALGLGIDLSTAVHALEEAPQVPGRLELVRPKTPRDFHVLVDYAHTPDAVEKAVKVVREVTPGRTICVFGCGGDRDATKRPLMGAAALLADHAVVTSDNPRTEDPDAIIADILPGMTAGEGRYDVIADRRAAIRHAVSIALPGDCVLIAGKGHEDYQLVGNEVLDFDDRLVAAEELDAL